MMDCRQIRQLLPLWIGQDLPDAATAKDVNQHLAGCPDCEQRRMSLQKSLDVLQGLSAETLTVEPSRQSVLPKLMTRVAAWDNLKYRDRFNGWIPASAMALAVALMVTVSIPSIKDEFFGGNADSASSMDIAGSDLSLALDPSLRPDQPDSNSQAARKASKGTPVVFRSEQW
jgi:hypothetical protein